MSEITFDAPHFDEIPLDCYSDYDCKPHCDTEIPLCDIADATGAVPESRYAPPKKQPWKYTACIESIFSQPLKTGDAGLVIYPNYTEIKTIPTKEEELQMRSGATEKRGQVISFSRKSRSRMMKLLNSTDRNPVFWLDLTCCDDVMADKTEADRAVYLSRVIKRFKRIVEAKYPFLSAILRKEWEPRKSGKLRGQYCPHLHTLFYTRSDEVAKGNYSNYCKDLAKIWVECTGTRHPKALKVAQHKKSYRWINDLKMAQVYISKYIAKVEENPTGASRGRYWQKMGKLPTVEPIIIPLLDFDVEYEIRKFLSNTALEREREYEKKLRKKGIEPKESEYKLSDLFKKIGIDGNCWMLIAAEEIIGFLGFINGVDLQHWLYEPI